MAKPLEGKEAKKVEKRCAQHSGDHHGLIRRFQPQKIESSVLIGFQNVRPLHIMGEELCVEIKNHEIDLILLKKTWHDPESIGLSKLRRRGLLVFEKARPRLPESVNTLLTNHGGVAVAFNSMFRGMLLKLTSTASFEHLCVRISSSSKSVIGLVVYRTSAASSFFHMEFAHLTTYNEKVLIVGDLSFHYEQSENTDAQTLLDIEFLDSNILDRKLLLRCSSHLPSTDGSNLDVGNFLTQKVIPEVKTLQNIGFSDRFPDPAVEVGNLKGLLGSFDQPLLFLQSAKAPLKAILGSQR